MHTSRKSFNNSRSIFDRNGLFRKLSIAALLMASMTLFSPVHAHRGPADEIDPCNIRVGPDSVHFTAYTPDLTGSKGYCSAIPKVGRTHLVFDYGGKILRAIDVEFEITKEPEGTRIFYQEPQKNKTGNFNSLVDFTEHGPGNYLSHITIVDGDKRLDYHIPFSVGLEDPDERSLMPIAIVIGLLAIVVLILRFTLMKKKTDSPEAGE